MKNRLRLFLFLIPASLWAQVTPGLTATGTPLVAYRAFFRQVQYLQTAAQSASPAEAAELQIWHQKHIGLAAQEAAQLKQIAATHVAAMDALEKQAAQIVQAHRAHFPRQL